MTLESGSGTDAGQPADAGTGEGGTQAGAGGGDTTTSTSLLNSGTGGTASGGGADPTSAGGSAPEPKGENTFLDQISDDELKADPNLQHINSLDDLAKSYVHAQRLVGKDKIPLPSDENDTEAWNDIVKKLGRPNDPSGYELPEPAEDSRVQGIKEEMTNAFKEKAHELGLTNRQANQLWGWYIGEVAEQELANLEQQRTQQREEAEKQLRQEFGNAFEDRIADAQRAAKEYGGEELVEKLESFGLANDPTVLKFLSQVGSTLREDTVGGSAKPMGRTPVQAQQELNELKSDPDFMAVYMDSSKTGHASAVEKMKKLYQDAFPDQ